MADANGKEIFRSSEASAFLPPPQACIERERESFVLLRFVFRFDVCAVRVVCVCVCAHMLKRMEQLVRIILGILQSEKIVCFDAGYLETWFNTTMSNTLARLSGRKFYRLIFQSGRWLRMCVRFGGLSS